MSEAPTVHPVIYAFIAAWFLSVIISIASAVSQTRANNDRYGEIIREIIRVTTSIQSEGYETRDLMVRRERRKAKRRAREAKLRLQLGPDAESMIAVQRILDAGAREREESES